MLNEIITALFYTIIATSVLFGLINLFRANLYDWRLSRLRQDQAKHPHTRDRRRRPLVSIVVYAHNDAETITDCLTAIAKGYRKTEIVVVDNASSDETAKHVREFIANHPRLAYRLVAKRKASGRPEAIAAAKRWHKGELVMVMDASCIPHRHAVRNSLLQANEPRVDFVLPNVRIDHSYQLLGLSSKFRAIATIWAKKTGGFIIPGLDNYNYAALYSRELFVKLSKPSNRSALDDINQLWSLAQGGIYDSQSLVTVHRPRNSFQLQLPGWRRNGQAVNAARGLLSLAEPLVACFMIYVALRFDNQSYLLLGWLSFTALLWLAIWSDESRGFTAKLGTSLLAILSYSLYIPQALLGLIRQLPWPSYRGAGYNGS